MPISRVRSDPDMIMVLAMPIAATKNDTAPMPPNANVNADEAKKLAAWLTAPEQQIKAFKLKGTFPSQVDALSSDDLLSVTNPFFNDAPTGQILADRAKAVTVVPFKGPNYFAYRASISNAINRVDVDKTDSPDDSWKTAASDISALG